MGSYLLLEILLSMLFVVDVSEGAQWSYKGNTGPSHWHELFPEACAGKMQSPINIEPEETIYNPALKDFAIYYDPPRPNAKMFVKNNGHAVQVDTVGDFIVTNGGLPYLYQTAQFHFHWGHGNDKGSEHHIAGQPHPLELHIVNFNKDMFETISEAVTEPMGLAVLGVLFEIVDEDNEALKPILEAMEEVRDPDEKKLVEIKAVSLRDLLPSDISRYFRYNGSLTTPGCFESVVWTVFEVRQKISLDQLLEFRKVLKPKHHKHKKHHKKHGKRSAAEKNAKEVLVELGIKDNKMEEDELKMDMMRKKMEEESHADATAAPMPEAELDEESARRAEDNIARHMSEKEAKERKAKEEHEKHLKANKEELIEYVQETLVNNYRPIQPINNRLIQRSFKLAPQPVVVHAQEGPAPPRYDIQPKHKHRSHSVKSENAGSSVGVSAVALLLTAFLSLVVKS